MAIYHSQHLADSAKAANLSLHHLSQQFERWALASSDDKNKWYWFGRFAPYSEPVILGRTDVLMHVHLYPVSIPDDLAIWNKIWNRKGTKVSDRALVYAGNDAGDFLLIHVFNEPGAHEIARKEQRMMAHFSRLAISFIDGDYSQCAAAVALP